MDATDAWSSDQKPSHEAKFFLLLIILGLVVTGVLYCCARRGRFRRSMTSERFWHRPSTIPQPSRPRDRYVEREVANERISAANAEIQALLTNNNALGPQGRQTTVLTHVNDQSRPYGYNETVRRSAPPSIPNTLPLSTLPPSNHEIETRNRILQGNLETPRSRPDAILGPSAPPPSYHDIGMDRDMQRHCLSLISRLEQSGHMNTVRVLRSFLNTSRIDTILTDSPPVTATPTRPRTPQNRSRYITNENDSTTTIERSWASYYNTANRLRDLTNDSGNRSIVTDGNTPQRHPPRSQTPPPAYNEVELSAVRIARADSLPSYDDFMASPHEYVT